MKLETGLKAEDPVRRLNVPSVDSQQARRIFHQVISTPRVDQPASPSHRRRLLFTAIPIVAAATVALLVLLPLTSGGPPSAAAAVFDQAAAAAAQQDSQLPAGQYFYTETESSYQATLDTPVVSPGELGQTATAQFNETDQAWTTANSGQSYITDGSVKFPSNQDEAAWKAGPNGAAALESIDRRAENGGQPTTSLAPPNVSNLPTDPTSLATVLSNAQLNSNIDLIPAGSNATFERAAVLLLGPTVGMTPTLASALFQVLAAQQGAHLLGLVTDHEGQSGQGVTLPSASGLSVDEVIVDPTTGQLLEADFAPPAATVPATSGGTACSGPVNSQLVCRSSGAISQATIAPLWTDVVATGEVNSANATLPTVQAAPTTAQLVPGAPIGLSAALVGPTQARSTGPAGDGSPQTVMLSWNAPVNPGATSISDYIVYEYQDDQVPGAGISVAFDTHSNQNSYVLPLLTNGHMVQFTVQAVNTDGYGLASSPATVSQ